MTYWMVLALIATTAACSGSAPIPPSDAGPDLLTSDAAAGDLTCAATLKKTEAGCVPVLDDCKDDEVPIPGGGCKRIGVQECDGGITNPRDWTCTPIGPPRTCLAGWSKVKGGWCEPILPAKPCPDDAMEVIGQASCQPVGDCGSGTWGKLKLTAATTFVDQSYKGGGSNGTQAKPYTTIGAAIKAAPAGGGGRIAVAAGSYAGVAIDRPLVLEGRCAKQVTIKGAVAIGAGAGASRGGAVLRGVTVTGASGVSVAGGAQATLERVIVEVSGYYGLGLLAAKGARVTVRRSLIVGTATSSGVRVTGAEASLEDTSIRVDSSSGGGVWAYGVEGEPSRLAVRGCLVEGIFLLQRATAVIERTAVRGDKTASPAFSLYASTYSTIRDVLVAGGFCLGIRAWDATAVIERTVVRDTGCASAGAVQAGISIWTWTSVLPVLIRDSLVASASGYGVRIQGPGVTVERTVIAGTRPSASGSGGPGIFARAGASTQLPTSFVVRDSLVKESSLVGIGIDKATATIERTVVRDTRLGDHLGKKWGHGVSVERGKVAIRDSLVSSNQGFGIGLGTVDATIERTLVRDTRPSYSLGGHGVVIVTSSAKKIPSLAISDCRISGSRGTGIGVYAATAAIERTVVTDTRAGPFKLGDGITAAPYPYSSVRARITLADSLVTGSARAGLLLVAGSARVRRSGLSAGGLPIALEGGATASAEDCELSGAVSQNRGLLPAPYVTVPNL